MEGFWGHLSRLHTLGLGLLLGLCRGRTTFPTPQPQKRARRVRVLGRQAINGAGVAVASRAPGNWRPSNHAKNVSCHPGSHAIRLAQLRPQVSGPGSTGADPDSRSQIHIGREAQAHMAHTTRDNTFNHHCIKQHNVSQQHICIACRPAWPPVLVHPIIRLSDNKDHKYSNNNRRLYAP